MNRFPARCLVDTNVPKSANLAVDPSSIPKDLLNCVLTCVEVVQHVVKNGGLVIDAENEIFDEYRKQLRLSGQPGVGDRFLKWVHDNRWTFPPEDRVAITKNGDSYSEFPNHDGLSDFDISDRKFVAVANAHPAKPPIVQATDSKWLRWQEVLMEAGISVHFLCPDYVKAKFDAKAP